MNYKEAKEKLGDRDSLKVANNTYLERRDHKTIALRLHSTDVLTFTPHWVELNTGGWPTMTTADRLNYGPVKVWGRKNGWSVFLINNELPCYCTNDNSGKSEVRPGFQKEFTNRWTGEPYGEYSKPIYEWLECRYCHGSLKMRGLDHDSGGYNFFDGIRVSNDGTRVLKTQPKKPKGWRPYYTESGRTGEKIWKGFAAHRKVVA